MISVTINGKQYELDGPTRVVDYLEDRGLANRSLAVAINGDVSRAAISPAPRSATATGWR